MISWSITAVLWAVSVFYMWKRKIWLLYYIIGAVGFALLAITLMRGTVMEFTLARGTTMILHRLLSGMAIPSYLFEQAPQTILVLIGLDNGWTTINIDIECSGLLEACVLSGLILFYPGYAFKRTVYYTALGLAMLYLANIIRMITIIAVMDVGGRELIYVSHTLIGRLVFFVLMIAIYWFVLTGPSLRIIRDKVKDA
ncbi:MAG: hypothetical protein ACM3QZ_15150 [Solirubrobacterales bacterium]